MTSAGTALCTTLDKGFGGELACVVDDSAGGEFDVGVGREGPDKVCATTDGNADTSAAVVGEAKEACARQPR